MCVFSFICMIILIFILPFNNTNNPIYVHIYSTYGSVQISY